MEIKVLMFNLQHLGTLGEVNKIVERYYFTAIKMNFVDNYPYEKYNK